MIDFSWTDPLIIVITIEKKSTLLKKCKYEYKGKKLNIVLDFKIIGCFMYVFGFNKYRVGWGRGRGGNQLNMLR